MCITRTSGHVNLYKCPPTNQGSGLQTTHMTGLILCLVSFVIKYAFILQKMVTSTILTDIDLMPFFLAKGGFYFHQKLNLQPCISRKDAARESRRSLFNYL